MTHAEKLYFESLLDNYISVSHGTLQGRSEVGAYIYDAKENSRGQWLQGQTLEPHCLSSNPSLPRIGHMTLSNLDSMFPLPHL